MKHNFALDELKTAKRETWFTSMPIEHGDMRLSRFPNFRFEMFATCLPLQVQAVEADRRASSPTMADSRTLIQAATRLAAITGTKSAHHLFLRVFLAPLVVSADSHEIQWQAGRLKECNFLHTDHARQLEASEYVDFFQRR